jgi:hypothetical protein
MRANPLQRLSAQSKEAESMKKLIRVLLASAALLAPAAAQSVPSDAPAGANAPGAASPSATSSTTAESSTAGAAAAANPANSSAVKARALLDQMVAALGGNAWLHYENSLQQGRSYSFFHGKPTSAGKLFWRFFEYPDKMRTELTKQRDVIYIFHGDKGYEITYKGTAAEDEKTVAEVTRARRHSLETAVRGWLADPRTMLFYDGQSLADRKLVDVVSLLSRDNDQITIGIDARSHLPINVRYSWRDEDKYKVEEETIYGNYRKIQGIQTPFTVTQKRDGEMSGQSFLSHAEYNVAIAPGFFDATVTYNPKSWQPPKKR